MKKNKIIKISVICVFTLLIIISAVLIIIKPSMHKTFNFNVIDYFVKINSDGSYSTTKQVTTTTVKGE